MNRSAYFVFQDQSDRVLETEYKVYIRTCRVIERSTCHVVMSGLHYLDAIGLRNQLNNGGTVEGFDPDMCDAGHPNAAQLLAIVRKRG